MRSHLRCLVSESERVINIEQTRRGNVYIVGAFFEGKRTDRMLPSKRENWTDPQIVSLVELDMQKMRVHIVLSRDAIRERLRELEHPRERITGNLRASSMCNCEPLPETEY